MPTQLIQAPGTPAGTATLRVRGTALGDPGELEIAIIQFLGGGAEKYLDPRNPDAPWTTSAYWFRPLAPRKEAADTLLDLDYGVTFHLRANQPYKLMARRADGSIAEDRFTCPGNVRKPTFKPEGWTPPAPPRGPLVAPVVVAGYGPEVAAPAPAPAPAAESEATPPVGDAASTTHDAAAFNAALAAFANTPPASDLEAAADAEKKAAKSEADQQDPTPVPLPVPLPVPQPVPSRTPLVVIGSGLLVVALAAGWFLTRKPEVPDEPPKIVTPKEEPAKDVPPKAEPAKADPAPQADLSLDAARKLIATRPPVSEALEMAKRMAEAGKQVDAQFLLLRYGAEQGNAEAARQVAAMYDPATWSKETSPLPGPNPTEAARWLKQAAEASDVEAAYRYGMLLKRGGTDEDNAPEKSVFWLRLAAQNGHEGAKKEMEQK